MKIMVTGGAGFIGSHVVDLYIANGHQVVIVDDLSTGRLSNVNPMARFYQVNICDPELKNIFSQEKPDVVNHHAAQMNVRYSVDDPLFDAQVNIIGSLHLIELSRQHNVQRFIYSSSGGAVYGEPQILPCNEEHPINPISPYGASKHAVEHYLYLYEKIYNLPFTIFRYPNVYGPRQNPQGEAGVIAIFAGKLLADQPVVINDDGNQLRDYVYVLDCAWANLLALSIDQASNIYNLGSGVGTSVNQLYAMISKFTGSHQNPVYGPARPGETRQIYLDASKIARDLGWRQQVGLDEGLAQTVEYIRSVEQNI